MLSQVLNQQLQVAFVKGEPKALRAIGDEARTSADAMGDGFGSRQCRWRLAGIPLLEGDLAEGIAQIREVIADSEADHDIMSLATGLMVLPQMLAFHGEPEEARAIAEAGLVAARDLGDVYLGANYVALMMAHLSAGDIDAAAQAADAGWAHLSDLYGTAAINSAYIAHAALARGDLATARTLTDGAAAETPGWYRSWTRTIGARVAIAEGDSERAERYARDALAVSAELGAYLGLPNILEILAGLISGAGGHQEAARLFGAAEGIRLRKGECRLPIFQAGFNEDVAALRNAMSEADFDAAWAEGAALSTEEAIAYAQRGHGERKRPSSGWGSLTPAELDVVRLVSEGLGNKDIAARLFVSPRTVQSHLTRVYTKLGLTSRVQLAQEATRRSAASNT